MTSDFKLPTSELKKFAVSCNRDCGGGCALTAHVDTSANRIFKFTNSSYAPEYMTGCFFGLNAEKQLYSPDRILKPLIRKGERGNGNFREASWNEALDLVASNLARFKESFGPESILTFNASGSCRGMVHNTYLLAKRFFRLFGPCVENISSYSVAASMFVTTYVYGTLNCGTDMESLFDSKLIILWGSNAADTRFSAKIESVLAKIKKSGQTEIVVIDPRKTRTSKALGTRWIPIYPGTDSALMCAMLYELISNNLIERTFIDKYSVGFERLEDYIRGTTDGIAKTPKWAEKICGISTQTISELAFKYGTTKPTSILPGLSIQRTLGGENAYRLCMALQTATGNVGRTGGSSGGSFWGKLPNPFCPYIPLPDKTSKYKFPVYRWADRILNNPPYENLPEIKLLYNTGSNYLVQGAGIYKNIKAFSKLDFIVSHEHFMTPTAKFSDVILPASMWMERNDILNGADNCIFYSIKAVTPPESVRDDYVIFCSLADKLGFLHEFSEGRSSDEWIEHLLSQSEIKDIEKFKTKGIYSGQETKQAAFSDFISDPHGNPLKTPSGKIEVSSDLYERETGHLPYPTTLVPNLNPSFPLFLITPHYKKRINSTNSNVPFFDGKEEDYLWINPADAAKRGILNGNSITVSSDIASIETKAFVTEDIMPGVVSLNQGRWPKFEGLKIVERNSANFLTSTEPTMPCEGSRTHSVFVEVKTF